MTQDASVACEQIGQISVVTFGSEYATLDGPLVKRAETELLSVADQPDCRDLVIDLSQVRFFGSAFLESLIRVWNQLKSKPDGQMRFCGLGEHCREVFEVTHMDQIWGIDQNRDGAISQLQSKS